jgi:CubicO group peptidase (beta-lactamase class C family)
MGGLKEIDVKAAGFDPNRFGRLAEAIEKDIATEVYDGCQVVVGRRAGVVLNGAFGFADRDVGRKMTREDILHSMSTGKQFTSAMALHHVERGDLRVTTPVKDVIPEFAAMGKGGVTLFHLLTHTSGLITELAPGIDWPNLGDLPATIKSICGTALVEHPGLRLVYSAYAGSAVAAEMVRRVEGSDRPWREVLGDELFAHLGMKDSAIGLPKAHRERICPVRVRGPGIRADVQQINEFMDETWEVPAGGCTLTGSDMYRFAGMLLDGGAFDGARFLSPAMINLASQNHTRLENNVVTQRDRAAGRWPAFYGLGFVIRGEGVGPSPLGLLASPTALGGMGHGSTMFFADPAQDVAMTFLSTGLIDDTRHFDRCQRYADLAISALVS